MKLKMQQAQEMRFGQDFLYSQIFKKSLDESVALAQKLAAIKLQSVGKLPEDFTIEDLVV